MRISSEGIWPVTPAQFLPEDEYQGTLVGRVWAPQGPVAGAPRPYIDASSICV